MVRKDLLSRRDVLAVFGATGLAAMGVDAQSTGDSASGDLIAGGTDMAGAFKVGERMWKGPLNVRSEVPKEDGNDFLQTDAGSNSDMYKLWHYNGGWSSQGLDVPAVSTDVQSITGQLDRSPGASGYLVRTGGKSIYSEVKFDRDNRVTVYDIANDEWSSLSPMIYDRTDHVAVYYDGGIWVFGCDPQTGDTVERYDIATDTWTEKPSLNVARDNRLSSNGVVIDGKVYICGGVKPGSQSADRITDVEEYDLDAETSSTVSSMPVSHSFAMQASYNGYLWLITGNSSDVDGGHIQRYDPSTDTWEGPSNFTRHPYNATDLAGVEIGNEFHTIGGWNTTGIDPDQASHYKYNMDTDTWTEVRTLDGHYSHGKAAWDGTYLWRVGGRTQGATKESFTNAVRRYHLDKGLESAAEVSPEAAYNFVLTYVDGDVPFGRLG